MGRRLYGFETIPYSVKEYGSDSVMLKMGSDVHADLKEVFPNEADELTTLAILRLIEGRVERRIT
ncbi:MAG: hypothetical protein IKX88_13085 [Thermoguttaceae bacterium]|nr:hypothetical protein [Thermoguttaceae bacterium]